MPEIITGKMNVGIEQEAGITLTEEHGFVIKEEEGKVLAFDKIDREDYGTVLLFGDRVYFVKFWDDEDIERALTLTKEVFEGELERRRNVQATS